MPEDDLQGDQETPSENRETSSEGDSDQKTREEAITLIRERTLTRLSPTESSPREVVPEESDEQRVEADEQLTELNQLPVVIMEPINPSLKRDKGKGREQEPFEEKHGSKTSQKSNPSSPVIAGSHASNLKSQSGLAGLASSEPEPSSEMTGTTDEAIVHEKGENIFSKAVPTTEDKALSENEDVVLTPASPVDMVSDTPKGISKTVAKSNQLQPASAEKGQADCPQTSSKEGVLPKTSTSIAKPEVIVSPTSSTSDSNANKETSTLLSAVQSSRPAQPGRDMLPPPIPKKGLSPIQETSNEKTRNKAQGDEPFTPTKGKATARRDSQSMFSPTKGNQSTARPHSQSFSSPTKSKQGTARPHALSIGSPSSTTSTWTSHEAQSTTHSSPTKEPKHNRSGSTSQLRAIAQPFPIVSHAHPAPPTVNTQSPPQPAGKRSGNLRSQKPEGFFWQLDSHGFPCAKSDCDKRCNLWDGATVICPRCGPYSEVRYCSKAHLFEDIKTHWANCGELAFEHPCRDSSIPRDVREGPPLLPCIHNYDTPERHRQAVHFNMNARKGDYFIFSDWEDLVKAGFPEDNLAVRCSSRVIRVVTFEDAKEKDRFRRVLAASLFMTIEMPDLVDYLFRLIRDNLRTQDSFTPELDAALKYQIFQEFSTVIQPVITGERHACPTDWSGRSRRNCRDEVCRGEIVHLLGSTVKQGYCRTLEYLEANHWLLRVARTTHPDVRKAEERMRGEGFDEVADEDMRVFCRGDGWDGAGSGEMEIEHV